MKTFFKIFGWTLIYSYIYFLISYRVDYTNLSLLEFFLILFIFVIYGFTVFFIIRKNKKPDIEKLLALGYKNPSYDEYTNIINNKLLTNLNLITFDNNNYEHTEFITDQSGVILFIIKQKLFRPYSYNIYNPFNIVVGHIGRGGILILKQKVSFKAICKLNIRKKLILNKEIYVADNTDYKMEMIDTGLKGVIYKKEEKLGAIDELLDKNPTMHRHSYFKIYNDMYIYETISMILGVLSLKKIFKDKNI